ncbi:MAG: hypothetical protein ABSG53_01500 [Thermoguttaceae bacterium]
MTKSQSYKTSRRTAISSASLLMAMAFLVNSDQFCGAETNPQDLLAAVQQRLATAPGGRIEISLSLFAGMMGGSGKQPTSHVTMAWHKPDFYCLHEAAWGNNPDSWYWLDQGDLQQFESFEGGKGSRRRAHGVRITNFARVAGDTPEASFRLAKEKARALDFVGDTGATFLELITEANKKSMTVEKHNAVWVMKQKATDFRSWLVKNMFMEDKKAAFVVFEVVEGRQPLKSIAIYPDQKKWSDYCGSAQFDAVEFALDRKKLIFPSPKEAIKSVEVKGRDKIDGDFLWRVPFTYLGSQQ